MKDKTFCRNDDVAFRTIESTTFLASPYSKKIYPLNSVGNFIWCKLEEATNFQNLLNNIVDEFDVKAEIAENDLQEFLRDSLSEKLIKECN